MPKAACTRHGDASEIPERRLLRADPTEAIRRASLSAVAVVVSSAAGNVVDGSCQALEYPFPFPALQDAVPISSSRAFKAREFQSLGAPSVGANRESAPRGIPLTLSHSVSDEDSVQYTAPPDAPAANEMDSSRSAARWRRAAFQWGVIFAVVYKVKTDRGKGNAVTRKLGLKGVAGKALIGKRYQLTLDVGRERGTWMPPDWGSSGRRIVAPVAVEFREGGVVAPIAVGAFVPMKFEEGTWSLDGDTLRFNMKISGMSRGDIELPEGKLYFKTLAWANVLSSNKGKLLLLQRRFVIRREWRSVGVFTAVPVEEADGQEDGVEASVTVPPMRVRERRTG